MERQLVSIIVLTYKKFDYLKMCLDSIIQQNYPNIEVIIQDDGSENLNINDIRKYFNNNHNNNIKNIIINTNETNLGTVKSFNRAIKISTGKIIIPLAADDEFYENNSVEKIVDFFEKNKIKIFTTKRQVIDANRNKMKILPTEEEIKYFSEIKEDDLLHRLCKYNFISGSNTYYKRELFDEFGYFNEDFKLLEDYPYYLMLLMKNQKVLFYDQITINYRDGGISDNGGMNPILIPDFKKVYTNIMFKNKEKLGKEVYRKCRLSYYRRFYSKYNLKYILAHIIYSDVVIKQIIIKLMGSI